MNKDLLTALEDERRYVARELHDSVAQSTLQLSLQITICRKLLERGEQEMLTTELGQLEARIQQASTQIREIIADMRPPKVPAEATLDEYLQQAIEDHRERGGPPLTCQFEVSEKSLVLPAAHLLTVTRIVQECLLNIRKHAQAKQVELTIARVDHQLQLKIVDDGRGFDLAEVEARPTDKGGAGLANLRARAEALGGEVEIVTGEGAGTIITLALPQ